MYVVTGMILFVLLAVAAISAAFLLAAVVIASIFESCEKPYIRKMLWMWVGALAVLSATGHVYRWGWPQGIKSAVESEAK